MNEDHAVGQAMDAVLEGDLWVQNLINGTKIVYLKEEEYEEECVRHWPE